MRPGLPGRSAPGEARLRPDDLKDESRFALVDELDHDDIVPFLSNSLSETTPLIRIYLLINLVMAVAVVAATVTFASVEPVLRRAATHCAPFCCGKPTNKSMSVG